MLIRNRCSSPGYPVQESCHIDITGEGEEIASADFSFFFYPAGFAFFLPRFSRATSRPEAEAAGSRIPNRRRLRRDSMALLASKGASSVPPSFDRLRNLMCCRYSALQPRFGPTFLFRLTAFFFRSRNRVDHLSVRTWR